MLTFVIVGVEEVEYANMLIQALFGAILVDFQHKGFSWIFLEQIGDLVFVNEESMESILCQLKS